MNVGRNLNIKTLQDTDNYDEQSHSAGIDLSIETKKIAPDDKSSKTITEKDSGQHGSISKGSIDSNYQSSTEQAGIYAGKDGFNINVGKNTDLKGAVIASKATPEKNKLSTDTLTYSDVENKADYKADNKGVNYTAGEGTARKDKGLTPDIGTPATGKASGKTKSAIAPGKIEIRSNPDQDIAKLSRDTKDALNKLGKIFDKEKVQERQELAKLFGEEAFKAVGDLRLKENDPQKVVLKSIVGGIMSQISGESFTAGATSSGINQLIINDLANIKDPVLLQYINIVIGSTVSKLAGGDGITGGSITLSDIKNNHLGEGHDSPPSQAGIGVETVRLGHVTIVIMNEDGSFEEGNFGRYVGVNYSSASGAAPNGSGTYITDNSFYPYGSGKTIYMLNTNAINANNAEYAYNYKIDSSGYERHNESVKIDANRYNSYYYKLPYNVNDYRLLDNNCATTTIDAITYGYFMGNKKANDTLYLLKHAIAPDQVNWILKLDYELYKGEGLVSNVIR